MGLYKVTLKELYGCEHFLLTGRAVYIPCHVPRKYRDTVCTVLNMTYNRKAFGYFVDEDKLFEYFAQRYPSELSIHGIDNYPKLLNRAKMSFRVR